MFSEFLTELEQKEIQISITGGKVSYSGPEQYIDDRLIDELKKYKGKLIKHFWPAECTNMMPINTEGSKTPFILLHGEKMNYPLSEHLGMDQPFYGFFHYGSEGEKIFHRKVESFAADYIYQLQKIVPTGPYLLAGFSFGGLVAFEMAVQLQRQGFSVPVLILIDCRIPSLKEPVQTNNAFLKMFKMLYSNSKDLYYWFFNRGRRIYYEFFLLFRTRLHKKNRNYYIMRTYFDIARKYKPGSLYNGEILLFKSQQNYSVHEFLGWDHHCNDIKMLLIKGDHRTLYESEESYNIAKYKYRRMATKEALI